MSTEKPCPLCGSAAVCQVEHNPDGVFYVCSTCGRFEFRLYDSDVDFNFNHLASYLLYHRFASTPEKPEHRYHTTRPKDMCDKYNQDFSRGNIINGGPAHVDAGIVENWYPKRFSEKVDSILLYLYHSTPHMGQQISWSSAEAYGALFVDRLKDTNPFYYDKESHFRREKDVDNEAMYMLRYLAENKYIEWEYGATSQEYCNIRLLPDGYKRVDELQKYSSYGRSALVAMKFGDDTRPLREAIRAGIEKAGYIAVFIDEVPHNDFITPELLKHIRDSKFVVVDLSDQNNGAYFEEGYAMGLGKPVIQLCKDGVKLHFDIAQKNTIIWTTEDDIPEKLSNRIKATID